MLGRLATYVIPSVAVAAAAFFLLGPGARRAALGVRVRGVPTEGGEVLAWRLEGVRRLQGVDDAAAMSDLTVDAWSAGAELEPWHGSTGADGIGEALIRSPRPLRNPVDLRVTRGGVVLAKGRVALRAAPPSFFQLATVHGTSSGDLRVRVDVVRGALAAPFADPVRVSVETSDGVPLPPGVPVTLEAPGAEIAPEHPLTDGRGAATVSLRPLAHDVELTVTVSDDRRRTGRWEGHLPIRPGAIWLDPAKFAAERKLSLLAPAPRDRAYVSVIGERGRIFGATVALAPDSRGFFAGEVALEAAASDRLLYAVVAGDPLEQGTGTAAWPLLPPEGAAAMRTVELLVDGVPGSEGREAERAAAARRVGVLVLVLAAALEVMLLLVHSREAQRRLEQHLKHAAALVAAASAGDEIPMSGEDQQALLGAARDSPRVRTFAFAALVALAFALIAAFVSIR